MSVEPSSLDAGIPEASSRPLATALGPAHTPQAGQYYRVDSSRSSYTELWRDARSPLVLIAWLTKLLRVKLPGTVNDPNVVSLWPFLVADGIVEEAVPSDVRQKLQPVMRELTDLGFGEAVYFSIHDLFHHSRMCQVALLHRDGRSVARVTHRVEGIQASKTHFFTEFLSAMTSGTFLCSSTAQAQLLVPAQCWLNWNRKASTSQLWVSHRQKLDEARQSGDPAVAMTGLDEMLDVLESHPEAVRDFQLARGVFSSMQGEDLVQAAALDKNIEQARRGQMSHPDVMAQLERLQKKQTSWTSGIFVLIVSIGLFVGAGLGAWKWSWDMLLMIVGILLVHEAGHYLAMRIFNYRNVRMFFIPFLGAAVSGQHYTAPGWKKVSVSLAGPLPGIFLGGVLGIAGITRGNDAMMRLAVMTVILNGLQLLPILPLDGGRVMQAVLFSRHHYLDMVFHVLTAGILVGVGALSGDEVLLIVGVFMAVGVPVVYKVAKIARELRREGFGPCGVAPAAAPRGAIAQAAAVSPGDFAAAGSGARSPPRSVRDFSTRSDHRRGTLHSTTGRRGDHRMNPDPISAAQNPQADRGNDATCVRDHRGTAGRHRGFARVRLFARRVVHGGNGAACRAHYCAEPESTGHRWRPRSQSDVFDRSRCHHGVVREAGSSESFTRRCATLNGT